MTMDEKDKINLKRPDPPQEITMLPVQKSGAIAAVGYDEPSKVLRVHFYGGDRIYDHFDVPPEVARDFLAAESAGKYYALNLKNNYDFAIFTKTPPPAEGSAQK